MTYKESTNLLKSNFSPLFRTILSGHKCILFWGLLIIHNRIPSVRTLYIRYFPNYSRVLNLNWLSEATADIFTL